MNCCIPANNNGACAIYVSDQDVGIRSWLLKTHTLLTDYDDYLNKRDSSPTVITKYIIVNSSGLHVTTNTPAVNSKKDMIFQMLSILSELSVIMS